MSSPLLRQSLLPRRPPWLLLGLIGAATGVGLFAARGLVPARWSLLFDPFACVAHGAAVTLALGLLVDAVRLRSWSRQLDRVGEGEGRPNWAAAAVAQCLAQFSHLPRPDEVRATFESCSTDWEERMEFRSNIYLALSVLLGLPLQLAALQRLAEDPKPFGVMGTVTVPLAVAGLEVLGVALPAFVLQRSWRDLFASWRWRVSAEETYRRFDTSSTAQTFANSGGSRTGRTSTARAESTRPATDATRSDATMRPSEHRSDWLPDDDDPLYPNAGGTSGRDGGDQAVTSYPRPPHPHSSIDDDEELAPGR